jgi:Icc-related predicted phosphoesterase
LRILAVSDAVAPSLFHADVAGRVGPVDLLLSCGDLSYSYLEFLVTNLHTRHAFYVHGNHDTPEHTHSGAILEEPGGWRDVDNRSVHVAELNLLVAGLEGSIRYKPGAPFQYTQGRMWRRTRWLVVQLLWNRVLHGRFLDLLIAHSPPAGIHDARDGAHRGFRVFRALIRRYRPRLFLHGHIHRYGPAPWHSRYADTEVVNVSPFRLVRWDEEAVRYGRSPRR